MSTPSAPRASGAASLRTAVFAVLFLAAALPALASDQDRYGYYRIVEGNASLIQLGESGRPGASEAAQENQPLLTGDRLWTSRGSRVEVVLADNTMLRVGADSELAFDELAWSGDANAEGNLLTLRRGEVQLVTDGAGETRVDTDNASIYLRESGSYRVESRDETTLLVVRAGRAEVRTRRGATVVDEDEEAWIEGDSAPEVEAAGTWDSLERWASNLDDQYRRGNRSYDGYVDSSLSYSSVRMAEYGSWVTISNRRVWRPRVGADWSPYRHGRWVYTPSGLTWSSYEPWGWVPYHYGSWDYTPGWGWAWYPGRVYAPAWVYWYWGPSYVGWCPFGYYSHYYGPRFYAGYGFGIDFTWGFGRRVHGWAGGSHWDRWNFVDCNGIYDRRLGYRTRSWAQLGSHGGLPRGIITTETRGLKPDIATRPSQGMLRLANDRSGWEKPIRELPDVSRFVARDPNVGADVGRWALPVDRDGGVGGRGDRAGVGRGAPGEKPAWVGGENEGATRRATSNPDWRSGGGSAGASVGGADPSGARNGRPRGGSDDWRSGGVARGGDEKPAVVGRPAGEKPGAPNPGDSSSGTWRTRPGNPDGGSGRGPSARVPGAGVTGKPSRPSSDGGSNGRGDGDKPSGAATRGDHPSGGDEGWRNGGESPQAREHARVPRSESFDQSPRGGAERATRPGSPADESWRSSGHEGVSGGRPPVRRIVEGMRS
ncbi:MAG TPA: DUF6600 domain-containing protein, partial [Thermoanaerobaculia bacterium]|nr:DUF6600 domain-containing protein [Thermoanaerobaculia bacterium]